MSDLVAQLREEHLGSDVHARIMCRKAADEIARLRADNVGLLGAIKDAEYAISNAAQVTGSTYKAWREFDYEDFCVWGEYWVTSARKIIANAEKGT